MASKFTKKRFLEQLHGSPVSKHLSNEPKAETSCSFLVLHPSSGVHTERCHFKLNTAKEFLVIISGCEFVRFLGYGNEIEPFAKGAVTLGNFSCNLSRNLLRHKLSVAIQVA